MTSGVMTLPMKRMEPGERRDTTVGYTYCFVCLVWGMCVCVCLGWTGNAPVLRCLMTKKNGWSAMTCGYSTRFLVRAIIPGSREGKRGQSDPQSFFGWSRLLKGEVRGDEEHLSPRLPQLLPRSPPGKPSAPPSRWRVPFHLSHTQTHMHFLPLSKWNMNLPLDNDFNRFQTPSDPLSLFFFLPSPRVRVYFYLMMWQPWTAHLVPVTLVTSESTGGNFAAADENRQLTPSPSLPTSPLPRWFLLWLTCVYSVWLGWISSEH